MEFMKDKINLFLLIGTIVLTSGLFFVDNFLCGVFVLSCCWQLLLIEHTENNSFKRSWSLERCILEKL